MSHIKKENLNKCISLLKEFIDDAGATMPRKGAAKLALNQLLNITAGAAARDLEVGGCNTRPRADGVE